MGKLHGKSVLLGIGIGTILTALLGFIFFLGYRPDMDEARVKELARKYGMVEPGEIGKTTIEITENFTLAEVAEKLVKAGLVRKNNEKTFQLKLASRKAKEKILPGVYEFRGNETEEEILDILIPPGES